MVSFNNPGHPPGNVSDEGNGKVSENVFLTRYHGLTKSVFSRLRRQQNVSQFTQEYKNIKVWEFDGY